MLTASHCSTVDPPFDIEEVITLCIGNATFAESLVRSFQDDSEAHLARLREHALQSDLQAASDVAHALKGSAAIVAAKHVARLAAEIEAAGKEGLLDEVRRLVCLLGQQIESCRQYLAVVQWQASQGRSCRGDE